MDSYNNAAVEHDDFSACYKKFGYNIVRFLYKMVRDYDAAEELAQDAFLKLYRKHYELDPTSPKTVNLITTVARRTALDYLKRQKTEVIKYRQKYFEEVTLNDELLKDVESYYIQSEVVSTLHDSIHSFPETMREALLDRFYEDKKVSAVSRKRNITKYRIRQAEKKLHEQVKIKLKDYF